MKITITDFINKPFIIGFCFYVLLVIINDIFANDILPIYLSVLSIVLLLTFYKNHFKHFYAELAIYFFVVIFSQSLFGSLFQGWYLKGILMLMTTLLLCQYLSRNRTLSYSFTNGVVIGIVLSDIYYWIFSISNASFVLRHELYFFSASSLGLMGSLAYYYGLCHWVLNKNKYYLLLIIVSAISIFLSFSKNAIIAMILISVLWLILIGRVKKWVSILGFIILFGIFVGIFYIDVIIEVIEYVSLDIEKGETTGSIQLNGRSAIWDEAIKAYNSSPWVGIGYGNLTTYLQKYSYNNAMQAHSTFYQLIGSVGIIGTIAIFVFITRIIIYTIKNFSKDKDALYHWCVCMLMYFLIRAITEGTFAQCYNMDVCIFFFVCSTICNYHYKYFK
ncbi:MAG: O-antigen ligase family protein [Bacteroidales bacterium]|nr:O-antigen ligase family protein [Bacteroidales bacterium]